LALFAVNMRESERERLARRDAYERELERRGKKQKLRMKLDLLSEKGADLDRMTRHRT